MGDSRRHLATAGTIFPLALIGIVQRVMKCYYDKDHG